MLLDPSSIPEDTLRPGRHLGPFALEGRIGAGGMGEVWRAAHESGERRVAIKIISPRWASEPHHREGFAREVRAVAGLDHDGIIEVYDHGTLLGPQGASRPYLVMEYMERGSLERLLPVMDWGLARAILLQLCEALSHAHARGIIHRDLKPQNVLLSGDDQVIVKIGDFGVAHALSGHVGLSLDPEEARALEASGEGAGAGTPAYMPPEQLRGAWRDFGPWTDLYALGCMAWELVTGHPPFQAASLVELATLHIFEELPRLQPRIDLPPDFERWLRRLLRKRPAERFLSAADAAWALARLDGDRAPGWEALVARLEPEEGVSMGLSREKTLDLHAAVIASPSLLDVEGDTMLMATSPSPLSQAHTPVAREQLSLEALHATSELPVLRPPWPRDWRPVALDPAVVPTPRDVLARHAMRGAGIGLYGLREVPFVGRERERDALWSALSRAHVRGPQVILVRGPSGVGKSRLAEWLAVRAQELGCALAVRVGHGSVATPADGLLRTIAHQARCLGLDRRECAERLLDVLRQSAPHERDALLEQEAQTLAVLISPPDDASPQQATSDEREQWSVLANYLNLLASRRGLVVWIDDAQWGASSLRFVRHMLAQKARGAEVLFVMTVRDDLLSERPMESELLEGLRAYEAVESLEIDALSIEEHRVLVSTLLGLEDELAHRLAERTLGNPLFAVQLVGDWIERGILLATPRGYQLSQGASVELPDDLHSLWRQRIGRLLAQRFAGERAVAAREALELAALLGQEVDRYEWEAVCLLAQIAVPEGLVETLFDQRLARATASGWALAHGMLRESLERVAQEAGRLERLHRLCVEMLLTLYGEHAMGHAERVASHLIASGQSEEALAPLIDAAYHYQVSGQYERAAEILMRYEQVTERLGLGPESLHVARSRMQRVWLAWSRAGSSRRLEHEVDALESLALRHGWDEILGECWRWRGLVARFALGLEESYADLSRARNHYAAIHDREGVARCLLSMAVALRGMGRLDEAEVALVEAVELASTSDFFVLLPRCFGNLAEVSLQKGDFERARERFERAHRVAEDVGDRKALAFAIGGQGELAMARGDHARAHVLWSRAEAIFDAVGSSYARVARVNLSSALVMRGRYDEARAFVERIWEGGALRDPMANALAHLVMLVCIAASGRFMSTPSWEEHLDAALAVLAHTDEPRHALTILAMEAARLARQLGEEDRARQVEALALLGARG